MIVQAFQDKVGTVHKSDLCPYKTGCVVPVVFSPAREHNQFSVRLPVKSPACPVCWPRSSEPVVGCLS